MICPRCGGELQATSNPNKLQCRECGRVFKNYTMRYYKCERCSQGCHVVSPYEVPDSCPYGFSNSQFEEITPLNFVRGVRTAKNGILYKWANLNGKTRGKHPNCPSCGHRMKRLYVKDLCLSCGNVKLGDA